MEYEKKKKSIPIDNDDAPCYLYSTVLYCFPIGSVFSLFAKRRVFLLLELLSLSHVKPIQYTDRYSQTPNPVDIVYRKTLTKNNSPKARPTADAVALARRPTYTDTHLDRGGKVGRSNV